MVSAEVSDAARHPPGYRSARVQALLASGAHPCRGIHCIPEIQGSVQLKAGEHAYLYQEDCIAICVSEGSMGISTATPNYTSHALWCRHACPDRIGGHTEMRCFPTGAVG